MLRRQVMFARCVSHEQALPSIHVARDALDGDGGGSCRLFAREPGESGVADHRDLELVELDPRRRELSHEQPAGDDQALGLVGNPGTNH